jgi:putative redox protein
VVLILRKGGADISGCVVETKAERAETDPKVFTKIHLQFKIRGKDIKSNLVERAIQLSHSKYCSATKMLGMTAEITNGYELVET